MSKNLQIENIKLTSPFSIAKMGTSGLRQKQEVYNQELFLEQFSQGVLNYFRELTDKSSVAKNNKTIIIGGDPREGNYERIRRITEIAGAAGFKVFIAEQGLASTPAMSHAIRKLEVAAGIILTASHNPFTDVGIKINMASGAAALSDTTDRIQVLQNSLSEVAVASFKEMESKGMIEYIDVIKMYGDLLDEIFDLSKMKEDMQQNKITAFFDAMNGAAGPFAEEVFNNRLGLDTKIFRTEPRQDLGGYDEAGEPLHPEPDYAFLPKMLSENATGKYDIVAAWDSDVDRRLDGGKGFFIESADEFALFAKYGELIKLDSCFPDNIFFCRSTVTAAPIDLMEEFLQDKFAPKPVSIVETPTGFKWIAELGNWGVEESNGVGNPYLREKDGIFSTVFLLKILLHTGKTVQELMEEIWQDYGRVYFTRGEVSREDNAKKEILENIFIDGSSLAGKKYGDLMLESFETWDYIHPETVDTVDEGAAFVLNFEKGNTVKARFSGTGSSGYTLRVYCMKYDKSYNLAKSELMKPMKDAFDAFLSENGFDEKAKKYTDSSQPDSYK